MSISVGIGLAFVAMLCWGIGDFWIQKSTRKVGDLEALFFVTTFGALVLLPFVYRDIPALFAESSQTLVILGVLCIVLFIAAILDFEALRVGKLAIVEPIWSFEVPVSGLLAFFILNERIGGLQILLIIVLLAGLAFVSLKKQFAWKHLLLERGTILAFFAAVMMGGANFFMGWFSRLNDPLMGNFVTDIFIAVITGALLLLGGKLRKFVKDFRANRAILLQTSVADKAAWVAFAFAMTLAPIGIAVALSESYIIIAVLLGLAVNRERLERHQRIGLVTAIAAAIVLASLTTS